MFAGGITCTKGEIAGWELNDFTHRWNVHENGRDAEMMHGAIVNVLTQVPDVMVRNNQMRFCLCVGTERTRSH